MNTISMLNQNPALAICGSVTSPLPYTIAFGGVATGSMNAQLAPIAAGTTSNSGSTPSAIATAASIGKNAAAVAVLLVTSVRNIITSSAIMNNSKNGRKLKNCSEFPIQSARPVVVIAAARLSPPPNSIKTSHGSLFASLQSSMNSIFLKFAGSKNISIAPNIAIPVSDIFGIKSSSNGLVIQSVATSKKTSPTIFSGKLIFPIFFSCFLIRSNPPGSVVLFIGYTNFVNSKKTNGNDTITRGNPISIHCPNPISTP